MLSEWLESLNAAEGPDLDDHISALQYFGQAELAAENYEALRLLLAVAEVMEVRIEAQEVLTERIAQIRLALYNHSLEQKAVEQAEDFFKAFVGAIAWK